MRPTFNFNVGKHPRKYIRGGTGGICRGEGCIHIPWWDAWRAPSWDNCTNTVLTTVQVSTFQLFLPRRYCSIQLV